MIRALLAPALALGLMPAAHAATDLDALLQEVREAQSKSQQINAERERRFLENKQEQARLLREARAELRPVERRTDQLRGQYQSLQDDLKALQEQLKEEAGELNQLVAVVRQTAGDLQAVAGDSLVTAQYPERESRLASLANASSVPSVGELEDLWYLLQQEMTATGNVVSFDARVIQADGGAESRRVSRIGPFIAVSGDRFLEYLPGTGLRELSEQPGWRLRDLAEDFAGAEQGMHRMAIDPTRGSVLSLLTQKPSLWERIQQGGGVGAVIIILAIAGLIVALLQYVRLSRVRRLVRKQLDDLSTPRDDNPLGRVLATGAAAAEDDPETLELKLDEAVLREVPPLQRAQPAIKLLAAVAPLMGLLGTVVGTGDPKMMAGGISQALMTTVLGLVSAIPLLFVHSVLASRSRALVQILDEQSAGLLARRVESSGGASRA